MRSVTDFDQPHKGIPLILAIENEARTSGDVLSSLGPRMGMSETAWVALLNQRRPVESLTREQLLKIAHYLQRPLIYVMSLAELVRPEDFVFERTVGQELNDCYELLRKDQTFAVHAPDEEAWNSTPLQTKVLVAILFGRFLERDIVSRAAIASPVYEKGRLAQG
jgi:hypothetical protein